MIGILLFLAFTVVPAAELWLLIEIGRVVGGWETVAYVIAVGMLGAWLGKRAGFGVMRQIAEDLRGGVPPADRLVEAGLVLVGSVLLITPGVLTDLVGILLFVAPVRRFLAPRVKGRVLAWLQRRGVVFGPLGAGPGFEEGARRAAERRAAGRRGPADETGTVRQLERKGFDHPVS